MPAGVLRALYTAIILCTFNLLTVNVFAQEEPAAASAGAESIAAETPGIDPITAAEQALPLGEDGAAVVIPAPASAFSIVRVILTLAVVAAAIYGIVFFIKRMSRPGTAQDPFLKILASTPLGANRSAHIVSVGSKAWLVGTSESSVNLIAEVDEKDVLDAMFLENSRKNAESPAGPLSDFRAMLRRLGMSSESRAPGAEEIRKRSERLKGQ